MGIVPVLSLPAPVLKGCSEEVGGRPVDALLEDLVETMRASPACVGLAAPQIGVALRAIVVDVTGHPKTTECHGTVVLVDPRVVSSDGAEVGREGCMSIPGLTANVSRATAIVVEGLDPAGQRVSIETSGFEARAFQHEVDHLDGLLILDRVASLATDVFRRKVYK